MDRYLATLYSSRRCRCVVVVCTGCTGGIGGAYTRCLARAGMRRLVLIDRDKGQLEQLEQSLADIDPDIRCILLVHDLLRDNIARVEKCLGKLNVGFYCEHHPLCMWHCSATAHLQSTATVSACSVWCAIMSSPAMTRCCK